jgi:hypothetical protein
MGSSTNNQETTISSLQTALNENDFNKASNLLATYSGPLDKIVINNLATASFMSTYIKSGTFDFSLIKSPLLVSLSNFVDKTQMKAIATHSDELRSFDAGMKLAALNCYFDNKNIPNFYENNKCLQKILTPIAPSSGATDTVGTLHAHTKCEPGLSCNLIKDAFDRLYKMHPIISKVLDSAAKSCNKDNCNIMFTFDDNYSVKDGSEPTKVTGGYYDNNVDLFMSGKNSQTFNFFAHEITHYAMNALYHNDASPYPATISKTFKPAALNRSPNQDLNYNKFQEQPIPKLAFFSQPFAKPTTNKMQAHDLPMNTFQTAPIPKATSFPKLFSQPTSHASDIQATLNPLPLPAPAVSVTRQYFANEQDFSFAVMGIDRLLMKPALTSDQNYIKDIIVSLKTLYPRQQIDDELVARYDEFASFNMTSSDLNYYLQPLADYYNNNLIPDINNYLVS